MRLRMCLILLLGLLAFAGCGKRKSTDELIDDLKSAQVGDRIKAVRFLPERKDEGARIVPALIESLKDKESDARWSAAITLGTLGEQAKEAVPALENTLKDRDARVREAAGVALSRIDPVRYPVPAKGKFAKGK